MRVGTRKETGAWIPKRPEVEKLDRHQAVYPHRLLKNRLAVLGFMKDSALPFRPPVSDQKKFIHVRPLLRKRLGGNEASINMDVDLISHPRANRGEGGIQRDFQFSWTTWVNPLAAPWTTPA